MAEILQQGKFSAPLEQAAVAAAWAGRGYSCRLFVDPPGQQWLDFVHDCNELVTVVEGRLEMTVGDEVFIERGAVHSVCNIHAGTTKWLFGYD
ncbi:MAG: cupin domain-containing protein [Alphaproteobacteria bacterium]|jgi:mannose-6-phosphate isomerase-like protein (cupin superfamily)|nr:cupin domain-containing protein [Alphaproteobacteria bacterium]MDP6567395.1 cupin domain-containing protein [Alphaproteobacteria bacterium]MDP6814835.1 cupin domain-containing protein [Alphaproteobacteria bacterium]